MGKSFLATTIFILILSSASLQPALADDEDYDTEFYDATQMTGRTASGAVKDTDYLVKGTTTVLHKENMAILAEIDKLHKEIADLKKDIKDVKDMVEGGK